MLTSTVVTPRVAALDTYWNPYEAAEEFNTVAELYEDSNYRNSYTDEVSRVNDKSANIFWRGTTDVRSYKPELQRQDTITTPAGHKLYPSFDKFGNRIIRWFDTADSNITFRFMAVTGPDNSNGSFEVAMFRNIRRDGKWSGKLVDKHHFVNCYSELSEQRATYWMMSKLSRSLSI